MAAARSTLRATTVGRAGARQLPAAFVLALLLLPLAVTATADPSVVAPARHPASVPATAGGYPGRAPEFPGWDPATGRSSPGAPPVRMTTAPLRSANAESPSGTPVWLGYDPFDQAFWVAALPSSVDLFDANATYDPAEVLPAGTDPFGVAVDPTTGVVYVTNTGSDNVTVYSAVTNSSLGSVAVGSEPYGVAFDAADNAVYVANGGSDNVSIFNATTFAPIGSVPVGTAPTGVAVDAATGRIFVTNTGSYNISVLQGPGNAVVGAVPAGTDPYGVAVDNATDDVFVTNEGSVNVSVINGSTLAVVTSIPVGTPDGAVPVLPQGLAYDSRTGQMYVGGGYWFLILLNGTTLSVDSYITGDPAGATYDPQTGEVCMTNTYNSTFQCFTRSSPFRDFAPVTFVESGLPTGTVWNLTLNNVSGTRTNGTRQTVDLCTYGYFCSGGGAPYVAFGIAGSYRPSPPNATIAWGQLTSARQINVSFAGGSPIAAVDFLASGLPNGTGWSVTLGGTVESTSGAAIAFAEPNGSYPFEVGGADGYSIAPSVGTVVVRGADRNVTINFTSAAYDVEFTETGLPLGAPWYVNFSSGPPRFALPSSGAIPGDSTTFALPNGSYAVTVASADARYTTDPNVAFAASGGTVTPAGATSFVFVRVTNAVAFQESGLAPGANWAVTLGGATLNSTAAVITFHEPNGSYRYNVVPPIGYYAVPTSGQVTVQGVALSTIGIVFASTEPFNVTFQESGLPAGTGWAVAIGGALESSVGTSLALAEPNGTYSYVVLAVAGFTTDSSGSVTVNASPVSVAVNFAPVTYPVVIVEVGLPGGTNWSVTVSNATTGFHRTESTNGSALLFFLPNGSYTLTVSVPPGYSANVTSAVFSVAGEAATGPSVGFFPPPPVRSVPEKNASTTVSPVGPLVPWAIAAILAVAVVVLAAMLLRAGRPPAGPPPAARPPPE